MKIIKKKTRRALEKSLRKVIKKHGPAIAAGLASGLASSLATLASTETSDGRGQSNLGKIVQNVQDALEGTGSSKPHKEKKTSRPSESTPAIQTEPAA